MRNPPKLVVAVFNTFCNYRCKFCYNSQEHAVSNFWTLDQVKERAGTLFDRAEILNISGCGEVSALPYYEQLLDYLATKPGKICLSTNGYKIKPELLRKHSLYEICFSLHSLNPETYDYLTGTKGRLSTVIENIRQMAAKPRDYRVAIIAVVTGMNYKEADDLADFVLQVGADELRFLPLQDPANVFATKAYPTEIVLVESPENLAILAKASEKVHKKELISRDVLSTKSRQETVKEKMPTCPNPTEGLLFNLKGEITPCCYIPYHEVNFGSLLITDWEEIWNSELYEEFRERVTNGTCELCLKHCMNWG